MTQRQKQAVHVIGGGLAGSEAAWQLAARGVPVVLHEMRPVRDDRRRTRPTASPSWCARTRSAPTIATTNAVGLLHAEMRRLGSLVMRAADAHQVPAGGALAVDRDGFSAAVTAALERHPLIEIRREEIALPPDGLGLASSSRPDPSPRPPSPRRSASLPARTRSPSSTRSRRSCTATRSTCRSPGSSRATTRRAPAAPAPTTSIVRSTREQYAAFVAALRRRREGRVPRVGSKHALFRRLPADRGDGGARAGNPAARAAQAVRPHQSAPASRQALRGRAAAPGQPARHALQHGRLPDQAEAWRAGAHVPHDPGPGTAPNSRGSADCTATPSSIRRKLLDATLRLTAMPRLRFAGQITGCEGYVESAADRACWPAASRPPNGWAKPSCRRRRPPRTARCSPTSPAGTSRRSMPARARSSR